MNAFARWGRCLGGPFGQPEPQQHGHQVEAEAVRREADDARARHDGGDAEADGHEYDDQHVPTFGDEPGVPPARGQFPAHAVGYPFLTMSMRFEELS